MQTSRYFKRDYQLLYDISMMCRTTTDNLFWFMHVYILKGQPHHAEYEIKSVYRLDCRQQWESIMNLAGWYEGMVAAFEKSGSY